MFLRYQQRSLREHQEEEETFWRLLSQPSGSWSRCQLVRARVEEEDGAEVVMGLRTEDVLQMGKNISGYKLYMFEE